MCYPLQIKERCYRKLIFLLLPGTYLVPHRKLSLAWARFPLTHNTPCLPPKIGGQIHRNIKTRTSFFYVVPGNRYITITKCAWFEEAAKMLDEEFRPLGKWTDCYTFHCFTFVFCKRINPLRPKIKELASITCSSFSAVDFHSTDHIPPLSVFCRYYWNAVWICLSVKASTGSFGRRVKGIEI